MKKIFLSVVIILGICGSAFASWTITPTLVSSQQNQYTYKVVFTSDGTALSKGNMTTNMSTGLLTIFNNSSNMFMSVIPETVSSGLTISFLDAYSVTHFTKSNISNTVVTPDISLALSKGNYLSGYEMTYVSVSSITSGNTFSLLISGTLALAPSAPSTLAGVTVVSMPSISVTATGTTSVYLTGTTNYVQISSGVTISSMPTTSTNSTIVGSPTSGITIVSTSSGITIAAMPTTLTNSTIVATPSSGITTIPLPSGTTVITKVPTNFEASNKVTLGASAQAITFTGIPKTIMISSSSGNTDVLYVGGSAVSASGTSCMMVLYPGDSWHFDYDTTTNPLYVISGTSGHVMYKGAFLQN